MLLFFGGVGLFLAGALWGVLLSPLLADEPEAVWEIKQGSDGHDYLQFVPESGNGAAVVHAAGCVECASQE